MAGSIEKRGDKWRLTVTAGYDGSGHQIRYRKTVMADNKREAEKLLAAYVVEVNQGTAAVVGTGKMTVADFFTYWLEHTSHEINTHVYYERLWPRINTAIGQIRLQKIEPRHILAFMRNLAEPGIKAKGGTLSLSTQKKYHAALKTIFTAAEKWRFISTNPCNCVEAPRVTTTPKKVYDQEQTALFLQRLDNETLKWRAMVLLALSTGLRREELFGLEWGDIHFDEGYLKVERASVYTGKTHGVVEKVPKNYSSIRTVSVPQNVLTVIKQYKTEQAENKLKLGDIWINSKKVFVSWNGEPAHPTSFTAYLHKFAIKNNLPHITPHLLRHMAATFLIQGGVDLRTVSGKLGHADGRVTMQVYAHLLQSSEQQTADLMGSLIEDAQNKKISG